MSRPKDKIRPRRQRLFGIFTRRRFTSAIVVAGGSSTRFGGTTAKQFLPLDGIPTVVHSLMAFEKSSLIHEILVVCRPGEEATYQSYADTYHITKFSKAVAGGASRQESSRIGALASDPRAGYVLIHDGARPLITADIIRDVVLAAHDTKAAIAATPSRDTVKIAGEGQKIQVTQDRDRVWLAATPQCFYKPLYEACASYAVRDGITVTDDAALLEHYFYGVTLVDCGKENIKITEPTDLTLAEALLKQRKASEHDREDAV